MNEKVSIVIPTYRREEAYLKRSIDSVLNQTYTNIEVVVVDDNPPDSEHRRIIESFMEGYRGDDRVVYLQNLKNSGGSIARNNGIFASEGDYITFLDDDDVYLPAKVEKQLAFMTEVGCDLSFTDLRLQNSEGKTVDYRSFEKLKAFDNDTLLRYHLMYHLTGTPTFMYRAEKLKEIGGFDDAIMGQEFFLMLKSIERGLSIRYFKTCDVIAYRHGDGGISFGKNKIIGENRIYQFKKQYFGRLEPKQRRYIAFRHHAVMAVAYKRNKRYLSMLGSVLAALFISPGSAVREIAQFQANLRK